MGIHFYSSRNVCYHCRVDKQVTAEMFKALGDPTRLRIFEHLRCSCGPLAVADAGEIRQVSGPTVGEVCCCITGAEKITSTISFHLKELRNAGLIVMERRGKHMVCSVSEQALAAIADYFKSTQTEDCCEEKSNVKRNP